MAALVLSSRLTKIESLLAYKMCWTTSVGYSLGVSTIGVNDLLSIQSQATSSFLAKLGINRNFPRSVAYGPIEYVGLGLFDLQVECGIKQIDYLMSNVYNDTTIGKLMVISIRTPDGGWIRISTSNRSYSKLELLDSLLDSLH
jgi:hypothetical protein